MNFDRPPGFIGFQTYRLGEVFKLSSSYTGDLGFLSSTVAELFGGLAWALLTRREYQ